LWALAIYPQIAVESKKSKLKCTHTLEKSRKRWQKSGKNREKPLFLFLIKYYKYLCLNDMRP
jgi:hypothetical protein